MSSGEGNLHKNLRLLGVDSPDLSSLIQIVLKDDLTELYNRRYFRQRLEEERKRVDTDRASLAIIMLDIDNFKFINDTFGHLKGDEILVLVGKLLASSVRSIDIVCRYAGDEFVVILPSAGKREAAKVARRIIESLARHDWQMEFGAKGMSVCVSLGYATYPRESHTLEGLIQKADTALYSAKKRKRGELTNGATGFARQASSSWSGAVVIPLLERERELARLRGLLRETRKGSPAFLLVEGGAGTGKTRLIDEFLREVGRSDALVCRGASMEGTRQMPLFPVREAIASFHRSHPGEFDSVCRALERPVVGHLSKILPSGVLDEFRNGRPSSDRSQIFASLSSFIQAIAKSSSLVFVIEDLQWADESSIEFLRSLSSHMKEGRLMFVCTARSAFTALAASGEKHRAGEGSSEGNGGWETFELANLSERATGQLVKHCLGMKKVPRKLAADLHEKTSGNPVFLKETLAYLVQQDMIEEAVEKGLNQRKSSPLLPQSILEMIRGRFGDLNTSVQRVLQAASVLGCEFHVVELLALLGEREGKLYSMLDVARRDGFLSEHFCDGTEIYAFTSSLMRDVIYHDMNRRKRKAYHREAGKHIEKRHSPDDIASLEKLARHFESAGEDEKAFRYLVLAGEKAKEIYASVESIRYFKSALDLAGGLGAGSVSADELLELRETLADVLYHVGQVEEARKIYSDLLEKENSGPEPKARLMRKLGEVCERECRYDKALGYLYKALNLVEGKKDLEYENIVLALAVVFMRKGEADKALHYSSRLLGAPLESRDDPLGAKVYFIIGSCHLCLGRARESFPYFKKSLRIRKRLDDQVAVGYTYLNIGTALFHIGKPGLASRFWERAMEIGKKTSNAFLEMACRNNAVLASDIRENLEGALASLNDARELAKKMGNPSGIASCKINIGTVERELGKLDQALGGFAKCLAMSEKIQNQQLVAQSTLNLGHIHIDIGDLERAEYYAWKALELTTKNGMKRDEGASWELLGDVNYERGNFPWALDCYRRARHYMEKLASRQEEGRLMIELKAWDSTCRTERDEVWEQRLLDVLLQEGMEQREVKTQAEIRVARTVLDRGGDPATAVLLLRRALERVGGESPRTLVLWHVTSLLARAHHAAGEVKEAAGAAKLAGTCLERIRGGMRRKWVEKSFLERQDVRRFLSLRKTLLPME
jgi:diguanylate cyclase (GGDEF)-like protein